MAQEANNKIQAKMDSPVTRLGQLTMRDSPTISAAKKRQDELIATPRAGRMVRGFNFPNSAPEQLLNRKRIQNYLHPYDTLSSRGSNLALDATVRLSSPESAERRVARLGRELNLATPASFRRKSLGLAPVPKAWSSLVLPLNEELEMKNNISPRLNSSETGIAPLMLPESVASSPQQFDAEVTSPEAETELDRIKHAYQQLQSTNEALRMENANLRVMTSAQPTIPPPEIISPRRGTLQSPMKVGFGLGHPDSDGIKQLESDESRDDLETRRLKEVGRQMFSIKTLVRSLQATSMEDRKIIAKLSAQLASMTCKLEESEAQRQVLEEELASLKGGQEVSSLENEKAIEVEVSRDGEKVHGTSDGDKMEEEAQHSGGLNNGDSSK